MKFFKRIGSAFHTRAGAYIFFALAATSYALFYNVEAAVDWFWEVYPASFVPAMRCVIGICAAATLGYLMLTTFADCEKRKKNRVLGITHTVFCVLAGALFGYTTVLRFGLDKGFAAKELRHGFDSLLPYLPYLGAALLLVGLAAVLASKLKRPALVYIFCALAICAAVLATLDETYIKTDAGFTRGGWHNKPLPENAELMISILPSERQIIHAEESEYIAFIHFGINTFYEREWGSGTEDPAMFNPTSLDTDQWARAIADAGMTGAILTAKHHDGFALWPTEHSEFSIKNSPYKDGRGDVVAEFAASCRKYGLKYGFYLSPWDLHEESYGTESYNDFYLAQLRELLTHYGEVSFTWFDGANDDSGHGRGRKQNYDWDSYVALVRELQPGATTAIAPPIPDIAWVGNEDGLANGNVNSVRFRSDQWIWAKSECDVSIRPGWFYHEHEEPKDINHLMHIYYNSIGMNCTLLLNIPPNKEGLLDEKDVARLKEFRAAIDAIYANEILAEMAALSEDGAVYAYDFKLNSPEKIAHIILSEDVNLYSERITKWSVYAKFAGLYFKVGQAESAGLKTIVRIHQFAPKTNSYRILIEEARGNPALRSVGFYK